MPITIDACVAQHIGDRKEQQDRGPFSAPEAGAWRFSPSSPTAWRTRRRRLAAEQVLYTARSNLDHYGKDDAPQTMLEASINEAHTMIKAMRMVNEKDPHSTAVMMLLQPGRSAGRIAATAACIVFAPTSPFSHHRSLLRRTPDRRG